MAYVLFVFSCLTQLPVAARQTIDYRKAYEEVLQNKNEDTAKVNSLLQLSFQFQSKNLDTAISLSLEALRIADKLNQPEWRVNAWIQLASNYTWQEQYDTAIHFYNRAITNAINYHLIPQLIKSYRNLAYLYELTEIWEKAFKYSLKALALAEEYHDEREKAYAYHEMASVYMGTHDYPDAELYLNKAKKYFKANDTDFRLKDRYATCLMDLANLYNETGRNEKAIPLLDTAIAIFTALDEPLQNADAFKLLGDIYTENKIASKATNYYNAALKTFSQNKQEENKYNLYLGMSKLAALQKDFKQAKQLLEETYQWAVKHGDDEMQMESLAGLIKTDSALGFTKQAFNLMNEYQRISDTVYRVKREQYTRRLEVEYKSDSIEKENSTLRKEKDQAKKQFIISTIIGFIFLAFLGLLYLFYRQKQNINKDLLVAQQHAQEANKELKAINQVKDKLFSILAHDLRAPLSNTLQLLQLTKKGDISQDEFKQLTEYLEAGLSYNNDLLDNLLNWAKGQMGGIIISKSKINLHAIAEENSALFEMICTKKKIELINAIPAGLAVMADENILRLAFRNIISNAIKFSKTESVILIETIEIGSKVQIVIHDKGIGLTTKQIQKIFSFDAISTYGTQKEKGAGIGLRITYEMIQQMGGKIWMESKLGEGTSVFLEVDKAV